MNISLILVALFIGIFGLASANPADEPVPTTTEVVHIFDCKKVMGRIAKKTLKSFGKCSKEVKANSTKDEFEKKMSCIIKCTLDKMEVLTEDGIVTKESIQGYMNKMVPEDAHDLGHALTEDCLVDHGMKLDKNQKYCESYGEFAQCMQNVIGDFADKANCSIGGLGRKKRSASK